MGTLSQIQHREQIDYPFLADKIIPDREYTVDDFMWVGDWYLSGQGVYRVTNYQKSDNIEPILFELLEKYSMQQICLFASFDESTRSGFDWHTDEYDVIATNFVGKTEWVFRNHPSIFVEPYDVVYVPRGIEHKVVLHSDERLSVSWIRND